MDAKTIWKGFWIARISMNPCFHWRIWSVFYCPFPQSLQLVKVLNGCHQTLSRYGLSCLTKHWDRRFCFVQFIVLIVAIICYSKGIVYLFQFTVLFQRFFDQLREFKSVMNSVLKEQSFSWYRQLPDLMNGRNNGCKELVSLPPWSGQQLLFYDLSWCCTYRNIVRNIY